MRNSGFGACDKMICPLEMDAHFFFRHSVHDYIEIRYALRGIAKHMPSVRKGLDLRRSTAISHG